MVIAPTARGSWQCSQIVSIFRWFLRGSDLQAPCGSSVGVPGRRWGLHQHVWLRLRLLAQPLFDVGGFHPVLHHPVRLRERSIHGVLAGRRVLRAGRTGRRCHRDGRGGEQQ